MDDGGPIRRGVFGVEFAPGTAEIVEMGVNHINLEHIDKPHPTYKAWGVYTRRIAYTNTFDLAADFEDRKAAIKYANIRANMGASTIKSLPNKYRR